ncbi:hypothetical protein Bca52824_026849 [Brassica carinata]|uniref:Uncharacterized protein n=1 Tax=Brassica carinata TaxID=52824 RepID=A0A8X7VAD2_BRACI|nr:hypothetical protein Bca52824_026849 [Brassica carinata]
MSILERPKKLDHRRGKKKTTSSEKVEEGHKERPGAGKGCELEQIAADERCNEPQPDTERDRQDEDVDRDEGEGDGGDKNPTRSFTRT